MLLREEDRSSVFSFLVVSENRKPNAQRGTIEVHEFMRFTRLKNPWTPLSF